MKKYFYFIIIIIVVVFVNRINFQDTEQEDIEDQFIADSLLNVQIEREKDSLIEVQIIKDSILKIEQDKMEKQQAIEQAILDEQRKVIAKRNKVIGAYYINNHISSKNNDFKKSKFDFLSDGSLIRERYYGEAPLNSTGEWVIVESRDGYMLVSGCINCKNKDYQSWIFRIKDGKFSINDPFWINAEKTEWVRK